MYIYIEVHPLPRDLARAASARGATRNTPADAYRYVRSIYIYAQIEKDMCYMYIYIKVHPLPRDLARAASARGATGNTPADAYRCVHLHRHIRIERGC